MKLPEILKEFRKENQLAQKEMANKLGITREYYAKIEKGRRIPSMQLIKRMAGFLTTNLFYVFPYDNEVFRKLQDEDENMPAPPNGRKKIGSLSEFENIKAPAEISPSLSKNEQRMIVT